MLKRKFPNYFPSGQFENGVSVRYFSVHYFNVRSSDRELHFGAITGISQITIRQTPEQNAPQVEAYLGLMRDGVVPDHMVHLAGRFTFDPIPVLRRYLEGAEQNSIWPSWHVFIAACGADPRWGEQLASFVVETARALPAVDRSVDRSEAYRKALNALNVLGQRTAWESLQAELGPETVAAVRPAAFGLERCQN